MRVAQYVHGRHLILKVASRSRGGEIVHRLLLTLGEHGEVRSIACSCEGFSYRKACHHLLSLRDLAGAPVRRKGRDEA